MTGTSSTPTGNVGGVRRRRRHLRVLHSRSGDSEHANCLHLPASQRPSGGTFTVDRDLPRGRDSSSSHDTPSVVCTVTRRPRGHLVAPACSLTATDGGQLRLRRHRARDVRMDSTATAPTIVLRRRDGLRRRLHGLGQHDRGRSRSLRASTRCAPSAPTAVTVTYVRRRPLHAHRQRRREPIS